MNNSQKPSSPGRLVFRLAVPRKSPSLNELLRWEPLGEDEGEESDTARFHVRITSFRKRLLDFDNLAGGTKYFTDCLRYAEYITEDSPDQITIENIQKKAKKEKTVIEIFDRWQKQE